MKVIECAVLIVSSVMGIRQDKHAEPEPAFPVIDWDQIEKEHNKPIQFESKDFTVENPHVEQAIIDEGQREAKELTVDRNSFVKQMMEFKQEAASELVNGHSKLSTVQEYVPRLKKLQLR